ncbi:MAG TPA: VWA domain-containing protein [Bryobacteraceae bacterium]|nr:VWA domain-containing protein [Bryobacteraceae bacterium]
MRRSCRIAVSLLAFLASALVAADSSQNTVARRRPSAAVPDAGGPDFKANSTVVLVNVTITDARGRPITGLQKENFQIFEEKAEQAVRYFSAEESPVSAGLVLDFSHSMTSKFPQLQEAVAQFLGTANLEDEFCLIEFRDRAELSIGFTPAHEDIENRVAQAQPAGHTALLDAVYLGLRQMKMAHNPRKALLVVSDGGDNHSRFTAREVENLARESDVEIYTIGIPDRAGPSLGEFEASRGASLLEEISERGGGRYYAIDNVRDLPGIAERIGRELRHQYVLGYVSSNPGRDGKYRRVQVKVRRSPGQPKLWAYWRRGYYAPME